MEDAGQIPPVGQDEDKARYVGGIFSTNLLPPAHQNHMHYIAPSCVDCQPVCLNRILKIFICFIIHNNNYVFHILVVSLYCC